MMTFTEMQVLAARRRAKKSDKNYPKAEPCYSRKARAKLASRVMDYERMISDPTSKVDYSGYHRPGSGNVRKG
jgi:hypothetical protein